MVSLVILSKNQIESKEKQILTKKFVLEKIWPILSNIYPLTSATPKDKKKAVQSNKRVHVE